MTSRDRTILRLLSESTPRYTTIERIAEETGAGVRTIHRDLEGLERSLRLRGVRLERRRGYGIRLIDPLPENLARGVAEARTEGSIDSGQRPMMVLLYLIASGDWVKISEVAGAMYVSDSTIANDLSVIESWLPPNLVIERHRGTGVRLITDEISARLLFLSAFPSMVPMYIINKDSGVDDHPTNDERFLESLTIRADRSLFVSMIDDVEDRLGYPLSPTYRGFLYAYLFIASRRSAENLVVQDDPRCRLDVPEVYRQSAEAVIDHDAFHASPSESDLMARVLACCETATPPTTSVSAYLGSLETPIEAMLEHALSRLEEKERVWLHDDRLLLNYFRLTMAAAARRIDLGVSSWWELGIRPFPGIEETPESAVLVSQFLADLGRLLREPTPAMVRREIQEASLAIGARLAAHRSRNSSDLRVKILCYEGLGMINYILALARDVFPRGTFFNTQWESDFENLAAGEGYDLVISTFPLRITSAHHLLLKGDESPDEIRRRLRDAYEALESADRRPAAAVLRNDSEFDEVAPFSLSVVMSVIKGFFVEPRNPDEDIIDQALALLDRGDCSLETMRRDFEKRESYGSLVFEEWNVRILHCRTEGIPEPRAGVIQHAEGDEAVLVLAAPITARQSETHALSEIVIALTEYADFPGILTNGNPREIQARLMTLFGHKAV